MSTVEEKLLPIAGPMPDTPEWHEVHKTHITASDMGAILGKSEYSTALDVYMQKTGQADPFEGNAHTRRGKRYEAAILGDYADATGSRLVYPMPVYYHPIIGCMAATPDANEPIHETGVEAKFSMSRARAHDLGEEGTDEIPADWLLQCQTQMAVMGWVRVDLAVLLYGRLRIYPVQRNESLVHICESAAQEMHERIINLDPPEPQWTHQRALELVKSLYDLKEGTTVVLAQECDALVAAYKELGSEIKAREKERDSIKARLLHALGDAEIGQLPGIGMEVIRYTVHRDEYTVKATDYETMRIRKA